MAEHRVTITKTQLELYLQLQQQVVQAQGQINAFLAGVLAGHDVRLARNVRLENDALVYEVEPAPAP